MPGMNDSSYSEQFINLKKKYYAHTYKHMGCNEKRLESHQPFLILTESLGVTLRTKFIFPVTYYSLKEVTSELW